MEEERRPFAVRVTIIISFNLACYASIAGHMEEAKARLQRAIDLDNDIRRLALDDEDLRNLWDWIGRIS